MAYLHHLARQNPKGSEIRAPRAPSGDILKRERSIANMERIHDRAVLASEIGRLSQSVVIPLRMEGEGKWARSGATNIENFLDAMPALNPINPKDKTTLLGNLSLGGVSLGGVSSSQLQRDNYRRILEPYIPVSHLAFAATVAIGAERAAMSDWVGRAIIQPDWLNEALDIANRHEGFTLGMSPRIPAFSFSR